MHRLHFPVSLLCSFVVFWGCVLGQVRVSGAGGMVSAWGYNGFGETSVPPDLGRAISLASGSHFFAAVKEDGTVSVWGGNPFGVRDIPPQATNVVCVKAKEMSCLALRRDGTLVAWGAAGTEVPQAATGIVAIATGGGHHLALRNDGALLAWGANTYGQCDVPSDATNVVAIEAGYTHSVALRKDGRVIAWGEAASGRTLVPPEATNVIAISAGVDCNLAVRSDGRIVGWGGLLGVPANVNDGLAVGAGLWSGLVIRSNGDVDAWGRNDFGELNVPPSLAPAFAVSMGLYSGAGIQVTGPVSLLAQPQSRLVGEGDTVLFKVAAIGQVPLTFQWRRQGLALPGETGSVLLLANVRMADAGNYDVVVGNAHNAVTSGLAVLTVQAAPPTITRNPVSRVVSLGGEVEFQVQAKGTLPLRVQWQRNGMNLPGETNMQLGIVEARFADAGQYRAIVTNEIGQSATEAVSLEVVPVYAWGSGVAEVLELPAGLTNVIGLGAGRSHSLVVKSDGSVVGWGDNSFEESTAIAEATNAVAVAAGDRFSLVLRRDGTVRAWGNIGFPPEDATNIMAIAAAREYGLLLRRDGTPFGWHLSNPLPMPSSATNLIAIAAGGWHQLGLRADGTVIGWGNNDHGQASPPESAMRALAIAAGDVFSLALRVDGTVAAWGGNWLGAIDVPPDATNILAIAAGAEHAVALRDDGRVRVWGDTSMGQAEVPAALKFPSTIAAGGNHSLALVDVGHLRFVREPITQSLPAGERAVLSAWAQGAGEMHYQWFKNGILMPGATRAYLILPNPQAADTGSYTVRASTGQGAITSTVASLTITPRAPAFDIQPTSHLVVQGESVTFTASAKGTAPINYQWRLDGQEIPGATQSTLTVTDVRPTDIGTYDVVAINSIGQVSSRLATITFQPTVDDFDLQIEENVWTLALQADGKALLGGDFVSIDGQWRRGLARLNKDGTLDSHFRPLVEGWPGIVHALAVQSDGCILVGGRFSSLDQHTRVNLARLYPDGRLDPIFNPAGVPGEPVLCFALQPDSKILVGGAFSSLGGYPRANLARLNPDGTIDTSFNPGVEGEVHSLIVQPGGYILVGGSFSSLAGQPCASLGRLQPDGNFDSSFSGSCAGLVQSLAPQADGRILVGGYFSELAGQPCNFLGRLEADGKFDAGFRPEPNDAIVSLAVQSDGGILAAGGFTMLAGQPRQCLGRLHVDGTLDATFAPETDRAVYALALQADGRLLVGGRFILCNGEPRRGIARVANTGPAEEILNFNGTTITWTRGGTGPVASWVSFEGSTNGNDWVALGIGERLSQEWRMDGLNLAPDTRIRARGFKGGGYTSGSGWFVGAAAGRPVIVRQPSSRTNDFGTFVSLSVLAEGTPPLSYQWRKDGMLLADGEGIRGARLETLRLYPAAGSDRAGYSVIISNSYGSVTSIVANLSVNDPAFIQEPNDRVTSPGETIVLSAEVVGTEPLNLQWSKNGVDVPGAVEATLTVSHAQWTDGGEYILTATNPWGSATSSSAVIAFPVGLDAFNPGANGAIYAMAIDPGNRLIVGGDFTTIGGQTHERIGRVDTDGLVDAGFSASANGTVYCLAAQEDGGLIMGGQFGSVADQPRSGLARLDVNGALDDRFRPQLNGIVYALAIQPDGRILAAGDFVTVGGVNRANLVRLHADGMLDSTFLGTADGAVYSIAVQPDGRLLAAGAFNTLSGQQRHFVGRLHSDGTLDHGFSAAANDWVHCLRIQADGRILLGGRFTELNGQASSRLGRLEASGLLDGTFTPFVDNTVFSLALQTDGRILVGGLFSNLGGENRGYFGRLRSDGHIDTTFAPYVGGGVTSVVLAKDGNVFVGGHFTVIEHESRLRLARLTNSHPAFEVLSVQGDTVTWYRSGSSPEIEGASFHIAAGVSDWMELGDATRANNAWSLKGVSFTADATLLARGLQSGGYQSGSCWLTHSSLGNSAFSLVPLSRTNVAGSVATFHAATVGAAPVGYQWLHAGTNLLDSDRIHGARTATLTLIDVLSSDAGSYQLVVTNASGGTFTTAANLTVLDPAVVLQPLSLARQAGTTASFSVQVSGTPPFTYQWRKNGMPLVESARVSGVHSANLWLISVFGIDAGEYSVSVSNTNGTILSRAANLTVLDPVITLQPSYTAVNIGAAATFNVSVTGSEPLFYQWRRNLQAIPEATLRSLLIATAQPTDAGLYDVTASNAFGAVTSAVARLEINQALADPFNPGADGLVTCLVPVADGRILVAGHFTTLGGQPQPYLGRLHSDGSLDTGFNPVINGAVVALCIDNEDRILLAGAFSTVNGQPRAGLCRLLSNGSLDSSFNPGMTGWASSILVLSDGKILVAGGFTSLGGQPASAIGRLHPDGTRDLAFTASAGPSVWCMALQQDNKIIVGGLTTRLNGIACRYIGRLHPDGTRDLEFRAEANYFVNCVAVQSDGRMIVGGDFTTLNGQTCNRIGRLNSDGTLDEAFGLGASGYVKSITLLSDGSFVVGGWFNQLQGQPRSRIGRFNADASLDGAFLPGANGEVSALAIQTDGAVLAGGSFETLAGQNRSRIARFAAWQPMTNLLSAAENVVMWQRGGVNAGFSRTTFEISSDHENWIDFGPGIPTTSGWQATGLPLPPFAMVRARGFVSGGAANASTWFEEARLQSIPALPVILLHDGNFGFRSNHFGFSFAAASGQRVVVESSVDMQNWTALSTNVVVGQPSYFRDEQTNFTGWRSYRLRTVPQP